MHRECRLIWQTAPPWVVARLEALLIVGAAALLAPGQGALAQTEIHKCAADDGSVVYQQLPCADETAEKEDPPSPSQSAAREPTPPGRDASEERAEPEPAAEQRDAAAVDACRQRYRDAIDRIDAEIAEGLRADEVEEYRGRARALSQALSRC